MQEIVREEGNSIRRDVNNGFDRMYQEIAVLRSEYVALKAAVERIEGQLKGLDCEADRESLRSELVKVKAQCAVLQEKIAEIEAKL